MKRLWILFVVVVLAACDTLVVTYDSTDSSPISKVTITADGTDDYQITGTNGAIEARPLDTNTDGNLRVAFWPADGPDVADEQTCAVWATQAGDFTQEGAALRVASDGSVHAITVTKNVYFGASWIFNFNVWDSTGEIRQFGQFDLSSVFYRDGNLAPLPWHLCARTLRGQLSFKAWPDTEPEPAWGDTTHGGSAPIPAGWEAPGKAGWYIGHLPPGGSATYNGLVAWKIVPATTTSTPS